MKVTIRVLHKRSVNAFLFLSDLISLVNAQVGGVCAVVNLSAYSAVKHLIELFVQAYGRFEPLWQETWAFNLENRWKITSRDLGVRPRHPVII